MEHEGFWRELWTYLSAVFWHWLTPMSGIVAVAVTILEYLSSKKVSARVYLRIAVATLAVATYLTWRDEHRAFVALHESATPTAVRDLEARVALLTENQRYRSLTPEQHKALVELFRQIGGEYRVRLGVSEDCSECLRFALSFQRVFEDVGWKVVRVNPNMIADGLQLRYPVGAEKVFDPLGMAIVRIVRGGIATGVESTLPSDQLLFVVGERERWEFAPATPIP